MEAVIDRSQEQPDQDGDSCPPVARIVGSSYLPGQFISARIIQMTDHAGPTLLDPVTYKGSTSYGLKQAAGAADAPARYTVDLEVHYPLDPEDQEWNDDCVAVMVRAIEIVAVDYADK